MAGATRLRTGYDGAIRKPPAHRHLGDGAETLLDAGKGIPGHRIEATG